VSSSPPRCVAFVTRLAMHAPHTKCWLSEHVRPMLALMRPDGHASLKQRLHSMVCALRLSLAGVKKSWSTVSMAGMRLSGSESVSLRMMDAAGTMSSCASLGWQACSMHAIVFPKANMSVAYEDPVLHKEE
jgi:hypothetical protein